MMGSALATTATLAIVLGGFAVMLGRMRLARRMLSWGVFIAIVAGFVVDLRA